MSLNTDTRRSYVRRRKKSPVLVLVLLGALVLLVIAIVVLLGDNQPVSLPRRGETRQINGDIYLGCTDKEQFLELALYATQGDYEAWSLAFRAAVLNGTCVPFRDDEVVYVVDLAVSSGLVNLRRRGDVAEYWTNVEAVAR